MNLKYHFVLLSVLLVACHSTKIQGLITAGIMVDGRSREYILYLPDDLPSNAPLVFVMHGFTDDAENMMNSTRMNEIADKEKFAVCYPQGIKDKEGRTFWEVGYDFTKDQELDDVKFLTTLARHLQDEYNLSQLNTFAAGMSNGAEMCMVLACKSPEVFKAVVPVCGCFIKSTFEKIRINNPIPVFMINSTADKTTSWEGDLENEQGWGAYLPVRTSFDFFVENNRCTQIRIDTLPDLNSSDGSFVVAEKHISCVGNNQVWLYTVFNGDHDWPGASGNMDIDASQEAWKFFKLFLSQ